MDASIIVQNDQTFNNVKWCVESYFRSICVQCNPLILTSAWKKFLCRYTEMSIYRYNGEILSFGNFKIRLYREMLTYYRMSLYLLIKMGDNNS